MTFQNNISYYLLEYQNFDIIVNNFRTDFQSFLNLIHDLKLRFEKGYKTIEITYPASFLQIPFRNPNSVFTMINNFCILINNEIIPRATSYIYYPLITSYIFYLNDVIEDKNTLNTQNIYNGIKNLQTSIIDYYNSLFDDSLSLNENIISKNSMVNLSLLYITK